MIWPERLSPDLLVQKTFVAKHVDSQKLLRVECPLASDEKVAGHQTMKGTEKVSGHQKKLSHIEN